MSAGAQEDEEWALLNDSPAYSFGGGTPVRNAPLAVAALRGSKAGSGLKFDITNVVSFVPDGTPISARIGFYSAPTRRPMISGGVEFTYRPGEESIDGTLVERTSEGTATTAEVWEEADEYFGDAKIEYAGDITKIRIAATGAYRKLLRDPRTAVGFDLWTDSGTVQPSVRVSIGDLLGTKPGLLALQGTGVAADGSPQPWITRPVATQLIKIGGRVSASMDGDQATIDVGQYLDQASQIRVFVANPFEVLPAGSSFPGYDLMLFGPDDTSVSARHGDAFASQDVGIVGITRNVDELALELYVAYRDVQASVQIVVPGDQDQVLLATGIQNRF